MNEFLYNPTPTGLAFHEDDSLIKGMLGPFASGKTTTIIEDILLNSFAQYANSQGVRETRVGVIRSTNPELKRSTRKSIVKILPSSLGGITNNSPMSGEYNFPLKDGTIAHLEFDLIALDDEDSLEKLKSIDWSFAWINEASTVPVEVINYVMGRIGRFPDMGCRWKGILLDFNPPPIGHYLYTMIENPTHEWKFFIQPPAAFKVEDADGNIQYVLNYDAENLENINRDPYNPGSKANGLAYYQSQIDLWKSQGNTEMIDLLFCLIKSHVKHGQPVFAEFNPKIHVASSPIEPLPYIETVVGYDTSGVHPALVFGQMQNGRWCITDELVGAGIGFEAFIQMATIPLIRSRYRLNTIQFSCDKANARDAYTGVAPTVHLENLGFTRPHLPETNTPSIRIAAVKSLLNKVIGGILISPTCTNLISALSGDYHYKQKRVRGSFSSTYQEEPEKNAASHIADALQYLAMYVIKNNNSEKNIMPKHVLESIELRRKALRQVV